MQGIFLSINKLLENVFFLCATIRNFFFLQFSIVYTDFFTNFFHEHFFNIFSPQRIVYTLLSLSHLNMLSISLTGTIPTTVRNFVSRSFLDVSNNRLIHVIPNDISKLVTLSYLNLSSNHLSGIVPSVLASLTKIEYLDISSND